MNRDESEPKKRTLPISHESGSLWNQYQNRRKRSQVGRQLLVAFLATVGLAILVVGLWIVIFD